MRSDATSPPFAKGTATRQRILDAAVARFASQGFRDTTVAAVARDAGVTAPAVHAYFGSKQELFHAAFEYDVTPVLEALYGGVNAAQISTQVTFEDGHQGTISARVAISDMRPYAARAAKMERAA